MAEVNCYLLSNAELATRIGDGYSLVGGPFATETLCQADCGGGEGYVVSCCELPIPVTVTITVSDSTDCSGSFTMTYNEADDKWYNDTTIGADCTPGTWELYCALNADPVYTWFLKIPDFAAYECTPGFTCDPLSIEFPVIEPDTPCNCGAALALSAVVTA